MDAVEIHLSHEDAPAITWTVSMSLACTGTFLRVRDLRASFAHSKKWFTLFMGALSYAIAISLSNHQEPSDDVAPYWFLILI